MNHYYDTFSIQIGMQLGNEPELIKGTPSSHKECQVKEYSQTVDAILQGRCKPIKAWYISL